MKPEESLLTSVQDYLKSTLNINISLPALVGLTDAQVNLKITTAHQPIQLSSHVSHMQTSNKEENRYQSLTGHIENLLSSSNLDIFSIENFMQIFNETVNIDIEIMQRNEITRANSFKVKEKLIYRINEITKKTQALMEKCENLQDHDEILNFIATDMKQYLTNMKLVSGEYEGVGKVEVLTPIRIDHIYEFESSSDEDYQDHYEPLLEVLVRLRANMNNLEQDVKGSNRIDMPLKSVNLLANCKNLLLELEPFLMADNCVFNRLIFHVVGQQTENMRLITSFYKHHLEFARSLVYNVFKSIYLEDIFEDLHAEIEEGIENERATILQKIMGIDVGLKVEEYGQISKTIIKSKENLKKIEEQIDRIKEVVCFGKSNIMENYLEEKICEKMQLLMTQNEQLFKLEALCGYAEKIIDEVKKIQEELKILRVKKQETTKSIEKITTSISSSLEEREDGITQSKSFEIETEKLLKTSFVGIQESYLKLSQIEKSIKYHDKNCDEEKLRKDYFPIFLNTVSSIKEEYLNLETKLLNSYHSMLVDNEKKEEQATKTSLTTLEQIQHYLTNEDKTSQGAAYSTMGSDILDEDDQANEVKLLLSKLDKAEYLLVNCKAKHASHIESLKELKIYRRMLEQLLVMFEESMDENVLQTIIDKMDFNEINMVELTKGISKVEEFLSLTNKFNIQLRKIIRECMFKNPLELENRQEKSVEIETLINNKILKIAKERLLLYEFIEILYSESYSIYCDLKGYKSKTPQHYDIESKGVKLFDKAIYNEALLSYTCLNKISVVGKQLNDASIKQRTKNYLFDDIYEPFLNRVTSFIKFSEEDLANLVISLEKALEIEKNYKNYIKSWETAVEKAVKSSENLKKYEESVMNSSKALMSIEEYSVKIKELNKTKFVILNPDDFKKIVEQCEEYIDVAKLLINNKNWSHIGEGKDYENTKILDLLDKIKKVSAVKQ